MLNDKWFFSREVCEKNITAIPVGAKEFSFAGKNIIDLDTVAGATCKQEDECIVYNEFELETDKDLAFGCGADWWFDFYLNGELIGATPATGNGDSCFVDSYIFSGKGKAGKNLVAVKLRRGTASWALAVRELNAAVCDSTSPLVITLDTAKLTGPVKIMNAVNNGPIKGRGDQTRGNMPLWQAASIPFARNHDAAFCSAYGGEHTVDVHCIFPDFSKDVNDPAAYDFTLTDRYIQETFEGGTETFYRLGSKIEHAPKKYGTKVPPDFKKWAEICEHIIRHYNEGWGDGFEYNIKYWEIWNEPDLSSGREDKKTWQGTDEEFFDLYKVAASHLKKCFPHIKIGGPALAGNLEWMKKFLAAITENGRTPLDFFSWHIYTSSPRHLATKGNVVRQILDAFGYRDAESILNEWNYVRGWTTDFIYSIQQIIGIKGAAFTASCMCEGQHSPTDMLMYYDARPTGFNGLFDLYSFKPLKTYFVFLIWKKLADLGQTFAVDTNDKNGVFAVGATDGKGKNGILISRYFEEDELPAELPLTIAGKGKELDKAKLYVIDEEHDLEEVPFWRDGAGNIFFPMKANSVAYLEF